MRVSPDNNILSLQLALTLIPRRCSDCLRAEKLGGEERYNIKQCYGYGKTLGKGAGERRLVAIWESASWTVDPTSPVSTISSQSQSGHSSLMNNTIKASQLGCRDQSKEICQKQFLVMSTYLSVTVHIIIWSRANNVCNNDLWSRFTLWNCFYCH